MAETTVVHGGKLVAVAYNATIYLLSDHEYNGLKDNINVFSNANENGLWTPTDAMPTPAGYSLGRGVFVAAKGKVTLLVDTDGDERADKEHIVAISSRVTPVLVPRIARPWSSGTTA